MKKIISLFVRNYEGDHLVRNEVVTGAEWVISGQGVATRKWDGTCCMIKDGSLYRRYDAKHGKTPPDGFIPAQESDQMTGHWPGWLLVNDSENDKWHREAFIHTVFKEMSGTYELVGPKIQNNPEKLLTHVLIPHAKDILNDAPRDFDSLKAYLEIKDIEGIVWHHTDERMVKIKKKDFGFKR